MANPRTLARIAARIKERAAHCVEFELSDPRASFITVTRVEVSSDLSQARIFYSVLGSQAEKSKAAHMLEDASGFVQRKIARVLKTRRVPRVVWSYDDSIEYAARMDQAIRDALRRDEEIHPGAHGGLPVDDDADPGDGVVDREYEQFIEEQDETGG